MECPNPSHKRYGIHLPGRCALCGEAMVYHVPPSLPPLGDMPLPPPPSLA